MKDLEHYLEQQRAAHLYRSRRISDSPQQVEMNIDGRAVINFCSNDYLGLANHPEVIYALKRGADEYGVGSGSAHLVNGHSKAHHELEERLAEFTGYERALLFSTGYMANLAISQTLLTDRDNVIEDRLNHASLIDSGLLSGARFTRYLHRDTDSLENKLSKIKDGEKLVMSDGVFSMDGDITDLPALTRICERYDAMLMIDDAHGIGVLGENGRGINEHFASTEKRAPIYMATLGKAVGTAGAFIAGDTALIETLIQRGRTYIYTTAQPPAIAVATLKSLDIIENDSERRRSLTNNIDYFRRSTNELAIETLDSTTAIQPIVIGDAERAVAISNQLFESGFHVTAIRPPTVPQDSARLRVTLSSQHTHSHIDALLEQLSKQLK